MTAHIFNIQRFSLHDGAGIRTSVFFQGCNLRCGWCANPESQPAEGAREWDVEALAAQLIKDKPFFDGSGGGITLTGGEPLLQLSFLESLSQRLRELGVHVAVETAACVPADDFRRAVAALDLIHIDLKHWDDEAHRRGVGVGLGRILENIRIALRSGVPTILRIPVIPGYNDAEADARGFARLMNSLGAGAVQLLPFHQMGERKYEALGMAYAFAGSAQLHEEDLADFQAILSAAGLNVQIGG